MPPSGPSKLRQVAEETLELLDGGSVFISGRLYEFTNSVAKSIEETFYYPSDCFLENWSHKLPDASEVDMAESSLRPSRTGRHVVLPMSSVAAARLLVNTDKSSSGPQTVGILNFSSAKNPGGGYMNGSVPTETDTEEYSLARSSTVYPTLVSPKATRFYKLHRYDPDGGYYSHSMIYSSNISLFRDESGAMAIPISVDIISTPAVDASIVRRTIAGQFRAKTAVSAKIERTMRERMARVLFLFERSRVQHLVLTDFAGGNVGEHDVAMAARIWGDLLGREGSRFNRSFDRVIFAIRDPRTFEKFGVEFDARVNEGRLSVQVPGSDTSSMQ